MEKISIKEQRKKVFLEEFKDFLPDLKARIKSKDKRFDYFIDLVCELPEIYNVKLDKDDLWSLLEFTIWNYNKEELKGITDKEFKTFEEAKPFLVGYTIDAYRDFLKAGKEEKPKYKRIRLNRIDY